MYSATDHLSRFKQSMFALIIGIDDYINCQKLRGAVADAKAMKQYLEQTLQVPEDHIRTLFDHEATRPAIIQAFKDVQNDERIKNGSPIVIFYAGHGGELPAPTMWTWWAPGSKIQCLLSQDYQGIKIPPIPDRTVGSLIENIAKVKGDNISVILDCCHSASGTRAGDEYVCRTIEFDHDINGAVDQDIWGDRLGKIHPRFAYRGLQSHVLLAACGEDERAYEHDGRGQFTTALLETLSNYAIYDLTYSEVLEQIHLTRQNPHCEGSNQHRIIFDTRVPAGRQVRYTVRVGDGKYIVGAGSAQGIKHGVEFTLYDAGKRKIGVVVVDDTIEIKDFQTTVPVATPITSVAFAKLTRVGNLPLYLTPGGNLPWVFEEITQRMHANGMNAPTFRLVKESDEAKLEVAMENDLVVLRVLDERLDRMGLSNICFKTTLDRLAHDLNAAAHYYWYLDLAEKSKYMDSKSGVTVDFYVLAESEETGFDEYGLPLLSPIGPSFRRVDPNGEFSDTIDFVVDEDALYGIKLTNNTPRDLYLNAFLFNHCSLGIAPYYTQSSIGNPKAPLKKNATFAIGYGPGGTTPFNYSLEEGQDIDIGCLKIFFATQPIDLSDIVQPPPFSTDGQSWISEEGRKAREVSPFVPYQPKDTWFILDIPIVQRRTAEETLVRA